MLSRRTPLDYMSGMRPPLIVKCNGGSKVNRFEPIRSSMTGVSMARGQRSLNISRNEEPHEAYKQYIRSQYRMSLRTTQLEMDTNL